MQEDRTPLWPWQRVISGRAEPHPLLRSRLIGGYTAYEAQPPHHHLGLPAVASVTMIIKVAESALRPPQFATAGNGTFRIVEGDCAPRYLEFSLHPLAAYSVFGGMPIEHLADGFVDLGEVLGAAAGRLSEEVRDVGTWPERFELVDRYLLHRSVTGPTIRPAVRQAWELITGCGGNCRIAEVADAVGWSNKHLTAMFRRQIGLSPKTVARLARFRRACRLLALNTAGLDRIAADAGYADQAHLTREFARFVGLTPTGYLRSTGAIRSRQDGQLGLA